MNQFLLSFILFNSFTTYCLPCGDLSIRHVEDAATAVDQDVGRADLGPGEHHVIVILPEKVSKLFHAMRRNDITHVFLPVVHDDVGRPQEGGGDTDDRQVAKVSRIPHQPVEKR